MSAERLIEFDQDLCHYILSQIRPELRLLACRPDSRLKLSCRDSYGLNFSQWLACVVSSLPEDLKEYIWKGVEGEVVRRSLSDVELSELNCIFSDVPDRFSDQVIWMPCRATHKWWLELIPSIQQVTGKSVAELWAKESMGFVELLNQNDLTIRKGIDIVHDWLLSLRRIISIFDGIEESRLKELKTLRVYSEAAIPKNNKTTVEATVSSKDGPENSRICTAKTVMRITGLKKSKLYELFKKGVLKGYQEGKMIRFYREDLVAFMKEREKVVPVVRANKPRPTKQPSVENVCFKHL